MTSPVPARPWLVLAGLALGVCVTHGFARLAYGLLLPAMKSEMGWTYAQAGWLNTSSGILSQRQLPPAAAACCSPRPGPAS